MKTMLTILGVLLLGAGLCACGSDGQTPSTTGGEVQAPLPCVCRETFPAQGRTLVRLLPNGCFPLLDAQGRLEAIPPCEGDGSGGSTWTNAGPNVLIKVP